MTQRTAILSLGSNQGDRLGWLKQAGLGLLALPSTRLTALSPVYETEPVDVPDGYSGLPFLNCVAILETHLEPHDLLERLGLIEARLGRTRGHARGCPRTIDIDIVALGDLVLDTPSLVLPHPRAHARRFVLQPLADLRPDFAFPGDPLSAADRLRSLPDAPRVWRFDGSSSDV